MIEGLAALAGADGPVGIWITIDPVTGDVRAGQDLAVALGALGWILSLVAGLFTAWLVLP